MRGENGDTCYITMEIKWLKFLPVYVLFLFPSRVATHTCRWYCGHSDSFKMAATLLGLASMQLSNGN